MLWLTNLKAEMEVIVFEKIFSQHGYDYHLELYCGIADVPENLRHLPIFSRVADNMASLTIQDFTLHVLFFNNYFTSQALFGFSSYSRYKILCNSYQLQMITPQQTLLRSCYVANGSIRSKGYRAKYTVQLRISYVAKSLSNRFY